MDPELRHAAETRDERRLRRAARAAETNVFNEHQPKMVRYSLGTVEQDVLELGERTAWTMYRENTGPDWQRESSLAGRMWAAVRKARDRQIMVRHKGQWRTLHTIDPL